MTYETEEPFSPSTDAPRHRWTGDEPAGSTAELRREIEPWLAALLQAEHVSLLIGSGFTTAVAGLAGGPAPDMSAKDFDGDLADAVQQAASECARRSQRGSPNLEDQLRAANELLAGLRIVGASKVGDSFTARAQKLLSAWESKVEDGLRGLVEEILASEQRIAEVLANHGAEEGASDAADASDRLRLLLGSFLLSFASRTATRERLHIFTTNYDRVIEYGCDLLGLRVLDRFVGRLRPTFRASRLGVDLHYNPPGMRGEPRYLEGVVRLTKLHGSIDWQQEQGPTGRQEIVRTPLPFGAPVAGLAVSQPAQKNVIVYPNAAKDVETLEYPYAELFRDFAAATCQPNSVVVTYGYGFGDDHINRVLRDMLTIPSAHLAILSYDDASGRIPRFCDGAARHEQLTLLVGRHFGDLEQLVRHYLPKPAIDRNMWRMVDLLNRRARPGTGEQRRVRPPASEEGK